MDDVASKNFEEGYAGKVVVANTCEDWWSVEDCVLLQVTNMAYEKMRDDYESKWWRYFDGDYEGIEESDILSETNLQDYILRMMTKSQKLKDEIIVLKKQIEQLSRNV